VRVVERVCFQGSCRDEVELIIVCIAGVLENYFSMRELCNSKSVTSYSYYSPARDDRRGPRPSVRLQLELDYTSFHFYTSNHTATGTTKTSRPSHYPPIYLPAMATMLSGIYKCVVATSNSKPMARTNSSTSSIIKRNAVFLTTIFAGAFATNMYATGM